MRHGARTHDMCQVMIDSRFENVGLQRAGDWPGVGLFLFVAFGSLLFGEAVSLRLRMRDEGMLISCSMAVLGSVVQCRAYLLVPSGAVGHTPRPPWGIKWCGKCIININVNSYGCG